MERSGQQAAKQVTIVRLPVVYYQQLISIRRVHARLALVATQWAARAGNYTGNNTANIEVHVSACQLLLVGDSNGRTLGKIIAAGIVGLDVGVQFADVADGACIGGQAIDTTDKSRNGEITIDISLCSGDLEALRVMQSYLGTGNAEHGD
jgi:hypothetical protein